jgi:uncharacterized protein YjiS (DUF1127 family)
MHNNNDNTSTVNVSPTNGNRRIDPFSARVLARYARQVAMTRFVRQIGKWLYRAVLGLTKPVAEWNRRNALYRELQALPDYLLKDIGFSREQIPAVVNNELRREDLALGPTSSQTVAGLAAANEDRDSEKPLAA